MKHEIDAEGDWPVGSVWRDNQSLTDFVVLDHGKKHIVYKTRKPNTHSSPLVMSHRHWKGLVEGVGLVRTDAAVLAAAKGGA